MSQKEQISLLEKFREGAFNVIIMTSVGEEGLDIPKVDLVIFYEPIPSAIRHIQRRGRTGRQEKGRVIVFMTRNTRDEAYRFVAHRKEQMMIQTLTSLRNSLKQKLSEKPANNLSNYIKPEESYKIVADYREKGNDIVKQLLEANINVNLEKLDIADY